MILRHVVATDEGGCDSRTTQLSIGCVSFSLLCTRYFSVDLSAETCLDDQTTYGMVSEGVKRWKYALVVELAVDM